MFFSLEAIAFSFSTIIFLFSAISSALFQICISSFINFHQSLKVNFSFILFAKTSAFHHQL
jgi:hypothetical protein